MPELATVLDPSTTTLQDICTAALQECGAIGLGQVPGAADLTKAWSRLLWMLQEWQVKRFLTFHLAHYSKVCTGATSYTIGPGGDIDTGAHTQRPAKIESAFVRQIQNTGGNRVDYWLKLLHAREDYDKIALKTMQSFPGFVYLDSAWPLGNVFAYPVPQANIYELHVSVICPLPNRFATSATAFSLPFEYLSAMMYNLAWRLRGTYGIPSFPGDPLPGMAQSSLNTLRGPNTQIAALQVPDLNRPGLYNIFSDQFY